MTTEQDYVLGTHDEELARLGLQHRVWRARALDAWRRAGFTIGQTLIDIGSGPGYATTDLAEIVGREGRVVAIDRSQRYLDALRNAAIRNGLSQIRPHPADLDTDDFPEIAADGAWARWVFAFVTRPRDLVRRVAAAIRPGGVFVSHEYFDYRTWRFSEHSDVFEDFVATVMRSFRSAGGEADIGRSLPAWLEQSGFQIKSLQPIVEIATPADFIWQWPKTFVRVGVERLRSLGEISADQAIAVQEEFARLESLPNIRIMTPAVLEIIATKM